MRHAPVILLTVMALGLGPCRHLRAAESASSLNPNIADARWTDYADMYPTSALCETHEITLWTCDAKKETYSLCSSREITEDSGYIQYRAGTSDAVSFSFPEDNRHPNGIFDYSLSLNGDAGITFENGAYTYTLVDRLRGGSSVVVSKAPGNNDVADIACGNSNQSLQLNYTLKLMQLSGVAGP